MKNPESETIEEAPATKKAKPTKPAKKAGKKKAAKKKAPKTPKEPKAPKAPKLPKEAKDADNVLTSIPTREEIAALNMDELSALFARILESEAGLSREKEGFLIRYYEHCEGLRHITAAKRHLRGEPPQEDNAYWASHPSRTWRTTGVAGLLPTPAIVPETPATPEEGTPPAEENTPETQEHALDSPE